MRRPTLSGLISLSLLLLLSLFLPSSSFVVHRSPKTAPRLPGIDDNDDVAISIALPPNVGSFVAAKRDADADADANATRLSEEPEDELSVRDISVPFIVVVVIAIVIIFLVVCYRCCCQAELDDDDNDVWSSDEESDDDDDEQKYLLQDSLDGTTLGSLLDKEDVKK